MGFAKNMTKQHIPAHESITSGVKMLYPAEAVPQTFASY